jgi:hypothetical protein
VLLTAIGSLEVVAPKPLIETAERLALETPDDCEWRSWVFPGARLQGLVVLWMTWRSDDSYSSFKRFIGIVGLLAFLFPRAYVDYGSAAAYTRGSTPEWRPWVYLGTRLVGLLYVVALGELRRGA